MRLGNREGSEALAGQEIVLAKAGKPYAHLMPLAPTGVKRQAGRLAGRVSDALFEPLPVDELDAWEGTLSRYS